LKAIARSPPSPAYAADDPGGDADDASRAIDTSSAKRKRVVSSENLQDPRDKLSSEAAAAREGLTQYELHQAGRKKQLQLWARPRTQSMPRLLLLLLVPTAAAEHHLSSSKRTGSRSRGGRAWAHLTSSFYWTTELVADGSCRMKPSFVLGALRDVRSFVCEYPSLEAAAACAPPFPYSPPHGRASLFLVASDVVTCDVRRVT